MSLFNIWVWEIKHREETHITRQAMAGIIPGLTLGEIADQLAEATNSTHTIDESGMFIFRKKTEERKEDTDGE